MCLVRKIGGLAVLLLFFLCFILVPTYGQKIKYDDLFYILNTKNYEEGEAFLRSFLSDSKNDDHANAHFQMGLLLHDKVIKADIFRDQGLFNALTDSSVYYYNIAKELIDEKEVRKNDEYYEEFKDRDVRSGKILVKVFNVHSTIDKNISTLQERKRNVELANQYYHNASRLYRETQTTYQQIQNEFDAINELYLRGQLRQLGILGNIVSEYDSFLVNFEKLRAMLREIPKSGYGQKLQKQEITDFKNQGMDPVDFLNNDIRVWDFSTWAHSVDNTIRKEVYPLKANLIDFDEKLENLLIKIRIDTIYADKERSAIESVYDVSSIKKFDQDPLPLRLLQLKQTELDYHKARIEIREKKRNQSDLKTNIELVENELGAIKEVDNVLKIITGYDIDVNIRNYSNYMDARYGGYSGLDQYLKSRIDFTKEKTASLDSEKEQLLFRSSFMLVNSDTVFIDKSVGGFSEKHGYDPLYTAESFSSGVRSYAGDLKGYFTEVNPSRETNLMYQFEIDTAYEAGHINLLGHSDGAGQVYYLLYFKDTSDVWVKDSTTITAEADTSPIQKDAEEASNAIMEHSNYWKATVVKLYKADGPSWVREIQLPNKPEALSLNGNGEVVITYKNEESMNNPESVNMASGDLKLDKDGNILPNG